MHYSFVLIAGALSIIAQFSSHYFYVLFLLDISDLRMRVDIKIIS